LALFQLVLALKDSICFHINRASTVVVDHLSVLSFVAVAIYTSLNTDETAANPPDTARCMTIENGGDENIAAKGALGEFTPAKLQHFQFN
jgi:hypothetical protein